MPAEPRVSAMCSVMRRISVFTKAPALIEYGSCRKSRVPFGMTLSGARESPACTGTEIESGSVVLIVSTRKRNDVWRIQKEARRSGWDRVSVACGIFALRVRAAPLSDVESHRKPKIGASLNTDLFLEDRRSVKAP